MMRPGLPALLVVLGLTAACRPTAEPPSADAVLGDIVGAVDFPASCTAAAAAGVERGVALLHHMMYSVAREGFEQAAAADPDCALAPWGVAMTYIHPLWSDRPTPDILAIGAELVARARTIGGATDRETAYIETVGAYFDGEAERTEAERLVDFEAAWQRLHLAHPDDLEGKAFFALAHLALADPDDRSLTVQRMAGAIAEEIYAAVPDHPGAHHYIIIPTITRGWPKRRSRWRATTATWLPRCRTPCT